MENDHYQLIKAMAPDWSLVISSKVEYRCEHGISGMFALETIPKGDVLVRIPKNKVFSAGLTQPIYPEHFDSVTKYCHAVAVELEKGERSQWFHYFSGLESFESLSKASSLFFNETELVSLRQLSELLYSRVLEFNEFVSARVQDLIQFDASISPDTAKRVVLNSQCRMWSDSGFLPVFDLFNHSDKKGLDRQADKTTYYIASGTTYKKGEQIFIRYSQKDMYLHAINFNYFDPSGQHFIHFGYRFIQRAVTRFEKEVLSLIEQKQSVKTKPLPNGDVIYRHVDPRVVFGEKEPSKELIDYLRFDAISTEEELKLRRATKQSVKKRLSEALNGLLKANHVDAVSIEQLPQKLHRFWHLLKKERQMLNANIEWVEHKF